MWDRHRYIWPLMDDMATDCSSISEFMEMNRGPVMKASPFSHFGMSRTRAFVKDYHLCLPFKQVASEFAWTLRAGRRNTQHNPCCGVSQTGRLQPTTIQTKMILQSCLPLGYLLKTTSRLYLNAESWLVNWTDTLLCWRAYRHRKH